MKNETLSQDSQDSGLRFSDLLVQQLGAFEAFSAQPDQLMVFRQSGTRYLIGQETGWEN